MKLLKQPLPSGSLLPLVLLLLAIPRLAAGDDDLCYECSGTGTIRSFYPISHKPLAARTDVNATEDYGLPQCAEGYQCVLEALGDATGYCAACGSFQSCPAGSVSYKLDLDLYNGCPDGMICNVTGGVEVCPVGTICQRNVQQSCNELQYRAKNNFFLGDIHAGMYCEAGSSDIGACEAGYYCPAADEKIICPAGKFCPFKTSEPIIDCPQCGEGETEFQSLYEIVFIVFAFILALCVIFTVSQKYSEKMKERYEKLKENREDTLRKENKKKQFAEDCEMLKPLLLNCYDQIKMLSEQSPELYTPGSQDWIFPISPASDLFGLDEEVDIVNEETLFHFLDVDGSNSLTFPELNVVLRLTEPKLRAFVKAMNTIGGKEYNSDSVDLECFVDNFLPVLKLSNFFGPTEEEARYLYLEICSQSPGDDELLVEHLYTSSLQNYLTDVQINKMIVKLREKDETPYNPDVIKISEKNFLSIFPELLDEFTADPNEIGKTGFGVDITFQDLSLEVDLGKDKKIQILEKLSGRIQAGTMNALMGGSGAGKTSLLNALCGRAFYGNVSGCIYINGMVGSIEDIKDSTGFVPQDDIVYAELTVRENFVFAGKFKLPRGTPDKEIQELADHALASLGLNRVANSLVGDVNRRGVSGGEKKRVNIGLELMSKPEILFLDEPTSGLDASSASLVMSSLSSLSKDDNVTVVAVIHQPRAFIFELFDGVILLSAGGKMVYHGKVSDSVDYFLSLGYELPNGENVADWMIDISSGRLLPSKVVKPTHGGGQRGAVSSRFAFNVSHAKSVKSMAVSQLLTDIVIKDTEADARARLAEQWKDHMKSLDSVGRLQYDPPTPYSLPEPTVKTSFSKQFYFNVMRNFLVTYRNRKAKFMDTMILLVAVSLISVLVGTLDVVGSNTSKVSFEALAIESSYKPLVSEFGDLFKFSAKSYESILQYNMEIGVILVVLISLSVVKVLGDKRNEFFREASSGYDINAYFIAINFTLTLELTIQMLMASGLAYGLRSSFTEFAVFFINFTLLAWVSASWAFFFFPFVPQANIVVVVGFTVTFTSLLFSGAISPFTYEEVYSNGFNEIFTGFIAPTRFFQEGMIVSEFRCLPAQTGFTRNSDIATNFKDEFTVTAELSLGQNDLSRATNMDCSGWYWGVPAFFLVGLCLRATSLALTHACNRGNQAKANLKEELKNPENKTLRKTVALVVFSIILLYIITMLTMTIKSS